MEPAGQGSERAVKRRVWSVTAFVLLAVSLACALVFQVWAGSRASAAARNAAQEWAASHAPAAAPNAADGAPVTVPRPGGYAFACLGLVTVATWGVGVVVTVCALVEEGSRWAQAALVLAVFTFVVGFLLQV